MRVTASPTARGPARLGAAIALVVVVVAGCGGSSPSAAATATAAASPAASVDAASFAVASAAGAASHRSGARHAANRAALALASRKASPTTKATATYWPAMDPVTGNVWAMSPWEDGFWIFKRQHLPRDVGHRGIRKRPVRLTTHGQSSDADGAIAFAPDGSFYVADGGNNRIQQFDAQRRFVRSWGSFGTGEGQFTSPKGIATDGKTVFVADDARGDMQTFDVTGKHLATFPFPFVLFSLMPNGNLLTMDQEFDATGKQIASFAVDFKPSAATRRWRSPTSRGISTSASRTTPAQGLVELDPAGHVIAQWTTGAERSRSRPTARRSTWPTRGRPTRRGGHTCASTRCPDRRGDLMSRAWILAAVIVVVAACGSATTAAETPSAPSSTTSLETPSAAPAASPPASAAAASPPPLQQLWDAGGPVSAKTSTVSSAIDPVTGNLWVAVPFENRTGSSRRTGSTWSHGARPAPGPASSTSATTCSTRSAWARSHSRPMAASTSVTRATTGSRSSTHIGSSSAQWGTFGTGDGQFAQITALATDGKTVYRGRRRALRHPGVRRSGTFIRSFGADGGFGIVALDTKGGIHATNSQNPVGAPMAMADLRARRRGALDDGPLELRRLAGLGDRRRAGDSYVSIEVGQFPWTNLGIVRDRPGRARSLRSWARGRRRR